MLNKKVVFFFVLNLFIISEQSFAECPSEESGFTVFSRTFTNKTGNPIKLKVSSNDAKRYQESGASGRGYGKEIVGEVTIPADKTHEVCVKNELNYIQLTTICPKTEKKGILSHILPDCKPKTDLVIVTKPVPKYKVKDDLTYTIPKISGYQYNLPDEFRSDAEKRGGLKKGEDFQFIIKKAGLATRKTFELDSPAKAKKI